MKHNILLLGMVAYNNSTITILHTLTIYLPKIAILRNRVLEDNKPSRFLFETSNVISERIN